MGLTDFYRLVDYNINKYLSNNFSPGYNILICFMDGNDYYSQKGNVTKIDIKNMGKEIFQYSDKLGRYNIINIRFSFEYFFKNREELETLYNFLRCHLTETGYLISYMIDPNKLNYLMSNDNLTNITYPIIPLYNLTDSYTIYGNKIKVGNEPFDEIIYLTDIDEIRRVFRINYLGEIPFENYINLNITNEIALTLDEINILYLLKIVIFKK